MVLKELRAEQADRPDARRWFLKEAQITAQLEHAHIIPVYDIGRTLSDRPFYTMKFVRGRTLHDTIADAHRPGRSQTANLRRLLDVFLGVCSAVAMAHSRGVIHRDLSPANVLVDESGVAYVSDWGLANELGGVPGEPDRLAESDDAPTTLPGTVLGTPAYMAPEQAMGDLDALDAQTDVYGLGAILFEILTGEPPFQGKSVAEALDVIARGAIPLPLSCCPIRPPRARRRLRPRDGPEKVRPLPCRERPCRRCKSLARLTPSLGLTKRHGRRVNRRRP